LNATVKPLTLATTISKLLYREFLALPPAPFFYSEMTSLRASMCTPVTPVSAGVANSRESRNQHR